MNLTDEQFGLIEVLVSNFESTGVADFCFTRSATGGGLSYEGASSVPGVYDAPDLHQLEREGLITLSTTSPTTFHCRLTQQGITVVHRKLTQQLFRNLTATYVPEGLKPGGMQFVYFGEAGAAASKEAESTECLQNGGVGPLMHHTISIPNIDINDYPSDLDDAELDQVKAAEIRGARAITLKKTLVRSTGEMETLLLRDWVLPIFAAFSTVAINRAKVGSWSIHRADLESRTFLDSLAAAAGMNSADAWMAGDGHIIRAEIRNQIEESAEFKRHQEKLLELVDARDSAVGSSVPVELTTDWGRRLATRTMADLPELPADLQNRFETQKANAELALNVRDPLQKVLGQINLRHEVFFAYCDLARELVRES